MPSAPIARATWMGSSVEPYFGMSARVTAPRRRAIHSWSSVARMSRLAHRRAEDDGGTRARCGIRGEPGVGHGHPRGRERHRRAAPHAPLLGGRQVVAGVETFHLAGDGAPERRRRRTTRRGEMPLVPCSSARKNASRPSPIELTTPTPVTNTRVEHGGGRYLALRCTCEQPGCQLRQAVRGEPPGCAALRSRAETQCPGSRPCVDCACSGTPSACATRRRRLEPPASRMPGSSRSVAPTLVDAVRRSGGDRERGFVFVRPDGTERCCSFAEHRRARPRGAGRASWRAGSKKGDRVALVVPDGDEFVLSFLGALFAGVVPVPIYPQLSFKNIESYHDDRRAHRAAPRARRCSSRPRPPGRSSSRCAARVGRRCAPSSRSTSSPATGRRSRRCGVVVSPDDLAFLQFTSGSTSRPKGVVVTHGNLAANAEAFMIHGLDRDPAVDKGVSWLPLFHDMGLIGFVVGPLFTNIPCVFLPTASFVRAPRLWLDKIHEHRGTITYAPNFAYALVAKRLKEKDVAGLDLSCLRVAGCGAEPIQAKALRDFADELAPARFDPRAFLPSYGMAEATLAITFMPARRGPPHRPGRPEGADRRRRGRRAVRRTRRSRSSTAAARSPGTRWRSSTSRAARSAIGASARSSRAARASRRATTRSPSSPRRRSRRLPGDGRPAAAVAPHGRPRLHRRRPALRLRPREGHHHRPRPQLLPERHRVGRERAARRAARQRRRVRGDRRRAGRPAEGAARSSSSCAARARAATLRPSARPPARCVSAQFGLAVHEVVVGPLASLPRTSSGKPQRRKTRQMYLDGTLPRARTVQAGEAEDDRGRTMKSECRVTRECQYAPPTRAISGHMGQESDSMRRTMQHLDGSLVRPTREQLLTMFRETATEVVEKDFHHVAEPRSSASSRSIRSAMLEIIGSLERAAAHPDSRREPVGHPRPSETCSTRSRSGWLVQVKSS